MKLRSNLRRKNQILNNSLSIDAGQTFSPDQEESFEITGETTDQMVLKKKKKIAKKKMRVVDFEVQKICRTINPNDKIFLTHGLSISSDGIIRFCYNLNHFSFGYSSFHAQRSNYQKNNDILEFQLLLEKRYKPYTLNDAKEFISQTPFKDSAEVKEMLTMYQKYQEKIINHIVRCNYNNSSLEQKDKHVQKCQKFIQNYVKENQNKIFQYAIGNIDYELQDFNIMYKGYSKSYLDLLGIDTDNFIRTILRNQQIDLHRNNEEIKKQSMQGLKKGLLEKQDVELALEIITYDGFPLKVYAKKMNISLQKEFQHMFDRESQYFLFLTEFDTDLEQIQKLIQYRQNLSNKHYTFSYDEFINKELSYMFEDVEYSVHSQSFLERYYSSNIEALQQLNQNYQQIKQQSFAKQCKYKEIQYFESQNIHQYVL